MATSEAAKGRKRRDGGTAGRAGDETRKLTVEVATPLYVWLGTLALRRRTTRKAVVEDALAAYRSSLRGSGRDADAREDETAG